MRLIPITNEQVQRICHRYGHTIIEPMMIDGKACLHESILLNPLASDHLSELSEIETIDYEIPDEVTDETN